MRSSDYYGAGQKPDWADAPDPSGGGGGGGGTGGGGRPSRGGVGGTSTFTARRSASYDRPYPITYGTSAVTGIPLWCYDVGDARVALDGANTDTLRCAEVQYALGFGQVISVDAVIYEKRGYWSGGIHPQYLSATDGTFPYAPEFFVGDGSTTSWAKYAAQDISTRIAWPQLALMRCLALGVPGGAGTVPRIKFVVRGKYATHSNTKRIAGGAWTRYDALGGDIIRDLLENTTYGMGLPGGTVITAVGADGTAASSYDRYCEQSGWYLALAVEATASIADIVGQVLTATNSVGIWSGGNFKIIPLGDVAVGTYTPVLSAIWLGDYDFVSAGQDGIRVTRQAWADTYNVVPVEYSQDTALRDAELVTTETMDVANVQTFGVRRSPDTVSLPCIRSSKHASEISGILARRSCYHRSRFEFTITAQQGAALECGDLVYLTHSAMGLTERLARVEEIEASPSGTYRIVAREWVTGASITVLTTPEVAAALADKPPADGDAFAATKRVSGSIAPVALSTTRIGTGTATVTSSPTTVTVAGGSPAYSYVWAKVSGTTLTVDGQNIATFSASLATGTSASSVYRCTVTDAAGAIFTTDVSIYLGNYTVAGPLAATASPTYVEGAGNGLGTQTVKSAYTTVSATGGTAPYTYAWTKVSGDTMTPSGGGTSAYTRFSYSLAVDAGLAAVYRCTVTDNVSATTTVDVSVSLINFAP